MEKVPDIFQIFSCPACQRTEIYRAQKWGVWEALKPPPPHLDSSYLCTFDCTAAPWVMFLMLQIHYEGKREGEFLAL